MTEFKRFHARREEKKRLIGRKRKSHPVVCANCHHWRSDVNDSGLCGECRGPEDYDGTLDYEERARREGSIDDDSPATLRTSGTGA